jgi:hypothetical protein
MNYEKARTNLWTSVYVSTDGGHETKVMNANEAVDAFDEKFELDGEGIEVSVEDIVDVLRKSKHN